MKSRKHGKLTAVLKVSRQPTYARNVGGRDPRWNHYIRPGPLKSASLNLDIKLCFPKVETFIQCMENRMWREVMGVQKEIRRSELYVKLLGLKKKSDKINGNHGP